MKKILLLALAFFTLTPSGFAGKATPFKGIYEIQSGQGDPSRADLGIFVVDADTLENIWGHWADGTYPAQWEKMRKEPSVFATFGKNNRKTYFLALEKGCLIGANYISVPGPGSDQMELQRRPDGRYDLAVKENNVVTIYLLAPPKPLPWFVGGTALEPFSSEKLDFDRALF